MATLLNSLVFIVLGNSPKSKFSYFWIKSYTFVSYLEEKCFVFTYELLIGEMISIRNISVNSLRLKELYRKVKFLKKLKFYLKGLTFT